jgi:hypothetical protein
MGIPAWFPSIGPAGHAGRLVVIAVWALSALIVGFAIGWLMGAVFTMAETSLWQQRMLRKLRYWQCEAAYARTRARHLARLLAAITGQPPETQDWPPADTDHPGS